MRRSATITMTLVIAVTCGSAGASDETSVSADGEVLHQRLPVTRAGRSSVPVFVYDPANPEGLPKEFQRDGVPFAAPAIDTKRSRGEVQYDPSGIRTRDGESRTQPDRPDATFDPRGTLGTEALADRDTEMEGTLAYHASFDPSVVPFKRNRALDLVTESGSLGIRPGPLEKVVPAGTQGGRDREVFWGSVLLSGRSGDTIPLPSVAASSRVLSIEASPAVTVTLWRDGAENFYVRPHFSDDAHHTLRLVYLMDAPKQYFGRALPRGVRTRDVPHAMRPKLPAAMQRAADVVAARIGLSTQQDYRTLLRKLVRHFRSFEPGTPPPDSGDVYRDLALGKRGICRHRAYAFVITAHGLGLPARYVFNEAHVFVEVWIPGDTPGWLRVDLGGGAERLVVAGADDKLRHTPVESDPFDRPAPYARQNRSGPSAGATDVVGLPPTRRQPPKRQEPRAPGRTGLLPPPLPLVTASGAPPTATTLAILAPVVYRGEPFQVSGTVTHQDGSHAVGQVRLVLLEVSTGNAIGLLRTVLLAPDGSYETSVTIPGSQAPGGYELVAEYLGGPAAAPSRSP
ncbi:MAG: transglutaminase domain-containing protein [Myxococcota bacterium]|nr:transglutaminase domain-containing protein [Myxococcota bacterium]